MSNNTTATIAQKSVKNTLKLKIINEWQHEFVEVTLSSKLKLESHFCQHSIKVLQAHEDL